MKQIRKTKIICTLGPSTDKEGVLRQLIEAGMDVARFNFSHGSHEEQLGRLERLREIREELNVPVAALMDTKGPEIRLKEFEKGKVRLEVGQDFVLTTREVVGDEHQVSITYRDLPKDVKKGDHILIDDGLIEMQVQNVTDTDITCKVMNGGRFPTRRASMCRTWNCPCPISAPRITRILSSRSRKILISSRPPLSAARRMWRNFAGF